MVIDLQRLSNGWFLDNALNGFEQRIHGYGTCYGMPVRPGEEITFRTGLVRPEDYGMDVNDYAFRLRI